MKKRICLLMALMMVATLLCGCSSEPEQKTPAVTPPDPLAIPTEIPQAVINNTSNDAEETGAVYNETSKFVYAGATPIPLDPIDMPTGTPKPTLTFKYSLVPFESLGIQFEAPQGWYFDSSTPDTITLIDPNTYDNVQASLSVSITSVGSDYKLSNVKQTLNETLKELSRNYTSWTQRQAASRTLMKKDGYYNRYTGIMVDGTVVSGQVRIALLDNNRIITVILTAPHDYIGSYETLLNHFRDTLKAL